MKRSPELGSDSTALSHPAPMIIEGGMDQLASLHSFVEALCNEMQVPDEVRFALKLAAEEAFTNIMTHGYDAESTHTPVDLSAHATDEEIALVLTDRGEAFDPRSVPPADVHSGWEERPIGGVGWHLIRRLIDRVLYEPDTPAGNRLTLVKRRTAGSRPQKT